MVKVPRRAGPMRATLGFLLLLAGCSPGEPPAQDVDESSIAKADLRLTVTVPAHLSLDSLQVALIGATFTYVREVAVEELDASVFRADVANVPSGGSYRIRVAGKAVEQPARADGAPLLCSGSTRVALEPNTLRAVELSLSCEVIGEPAYDDAAASDESDAAEPPEANDAAALAPDAGPDDAAAVTPMPAIDAALDAGPSSSSDASTQDDAEASRDGALPDAQACGAGCDGGCSGGSCAPQVPRIVQVATGEVHTCALSSDGRVLCWGSNQYGQLGDGTTADSTVPVRAARVANAQAIAAGFRHSCALLRSGAVVCWGNNGLAQLGIGSASGRGTRTVFVDGIDDATRIAAGAHHTCVANASGSVRCWGANDSGQLGYGVFGGASSTPVSVLDLASASMLALGAQYSLALKANGDATAWGNANAGSLGNGKAGGDYSTSAPPYLGAVELRPVGVRVIQRDATQIAAGAVRSCTVFRAGAVACWGGLPADGSDTRSPTVVPGLSGVAEVVVGETQFCARFTAGSVACSALYQESLASPVTGLNETVQLSSKTKHTCAVARDGTVRCWGENSYGQLGDGSVATRASPVAVGFPPLPAIDPNAGPVLDTCPALVSPEDGSVTYSAATRVGSVASYTCNSGFTARPALLTRTCQASAREPFWDGESVRCMRPSCGDGVVSGDEQCDPDAPNQNLWTCSSRCQRLDLFQRCQGSARNPGCPNDDTCVNGMCLGRCFDGARKCPVLPSGAPANVIDSCQYTEAFGGGICWLEGCQTSRDCPSGSICSNGRCSACSSSAQCPPETPTCVPISGFTWRGTNCQKLPPCASHAECATGQICAPTGLGTSVMTCRRCANDGECPAATPYCWAGYNDNDSCRAEKP